MRKYLDIESGSGKKVSIAVNKIYSLLNDLGFEFPLGSDVVIEIKKLLDMIGEEMDDGIDWSIDEYR